MIQTLSLVSLLMAPSLMAAQGSFTIPIETMEVDKNEGHPLLEGKHTKNNIRCSWEEYQHRYG